MSAESKREKTLKQACDDIRAAYIGKKKQVTVMGILMNLHKQTTGKTVYEGDLQFRVRHECCVAYPASGAQFPVFNLSVKRTKTVVLKRGKKGKKGKKP